MSTQRPRRGGGNRWPDQTPEQRFWAKVDKTGECWLWTAGKDVHGYGRFYVGPGVANRCQPAHRISWQMDNGPIPDGLFIDHLCFTPACVRPSHLRLATNKQNHENRPGAQPNSRSGIRGVGWSKRNRKWRARVKHYGVEHHVGDFDSIEEAEAAVIAKRNELYTHNSVDRRAS